MAARKRKPARRRDYRAEYARRVERARKLKYSLDVARGHPKPDEVGRAELRQLRRAARIPSPGRGGTPGESRVRQRAMLRVAQMAGVVDAVGGEVRMDAAELFAELFAELTGASLQEAYTLWFSP